MKWLFVWYNGKKLQKKLYNLYLAKQKVDYYYLALLLTPGRNIVGCKIQ